MSRRRYATAVLVFFFLSFAALEIAGNADPLLSGAAQSMSWNPLVLLRGLSGRGILLWLLLIALGGLGVVWAMIGNVQLKYRSKLYEVLPGFAIPYPEGQGQYGTAWWLTETEQHRSFSSVLLPEKLELSAQLQEHYQQERRSIQNEKHEMARFEARRTGDWNVSR